MGEQISLILYGRSYCHLCEKMQIAITAQKEFSRCKFRVVDIDADPALVEQYDERVPVLLADGEELFHYHFSETAWQRFFSAPTI